MKSIDFKKFSFHPVIKLPKSYEILDLSKGPVSSSSKYTIGKYAEKRENLYVKDVFTKENRQFHMGLDIGAPEGTPFYAPLEGEVFCFEDRKEEGDYGPTLITTHVLDEVRFYILFGHLSRPSLKDKKNGGPFKKGEILGFIGSKEENGNWPPHIHIQLSYIPPKGSDLPGVVSEKDLKWALKAFPDPRVLLGPLY